jgi:hypothetical protein
VVYSELTYVERTKVDPTVNSSVHDTLVGDCPPNAVAAEDIPEPAKLFLATLINAADDQDVPLYTSVVAQTATLYPPNITAFKLDEPAPAGNALVVINAVAEDQVEPLNNSAHEIATYVGYVAPPAAIAEF